MDKSSGCEKHLAILSKIGRPPKKEIERMMNNAQRYRSEDEKERERIAIKSTFESYCLKVRNMLRDENSKDNFSDADKKTILNKCNEIDKWQQNNLSIGNTSRLSLYILFYFNSSFVKGSSHLRKNFSRS